MNEETQVTETLEDDWGDITLNDADIVDDDAKFEDETNEEKPEDAEETTSETDEADPAEQKEDEADKEEPETEETKETDQFTLKYLGEEKSVSRDEIVPLAQKGMDYDRVRTKFDELNTEHTTLKTEHTTLQAEKSKADEVIGFITGLAKEQGFNDINAFLDETKAGIIANRDNIDISVARGRVSNERKAKELADKEAKLSTEKAEKQTAEQEAQKAKERQQADILAFAKAYPNVKPDDIPPEVWQAVKGGESLVTAYKEYSLAQREAKIAEQEAKAEVDKKNAENKKRSTGSRASVGKTTKKDDFDSLWYDGD